MPTPGTGDVLPIGTGSGDTLGSGVGVIAGVVLGKGVITAGLAGAVTGWAFVIERLTTVRREANKSFMISGYRHSRGLRLFKN